MRLTIIYGIYATKQTASIRKFIANGNLIYSLRWLVCISSKLLCDAKFYMNDLTKHFDLFVNKIFVALKIVL